MIIAQTDVTAPFNSELTAWDYGQAVIVFAGAVVLAQVARVVIRRVVARSPADDFLGDLFGRVASYLIVVIGLIYALEGLGVAIGPLLGALGIAGIAIAFALQDILENFAAGVILQLRRPFTAGDEIESGDHEGTIVAVDARTVTVLTPDGETVRLPSADVIKNPIVNHTQNGRRRTTVEVGVAYDTDLARAKQVAVDATASVAAVLDDPAPEALVHTFGPSSIDIAIRFWHAPSIATHWHSRDEVVRAVALAFDGANIEIPFPQQVLHQAPATDESS